MDSGPTTGANESSKTWASRPALAKIVRVVLFLAPVFVGWLAVRLTGTLYWRPAGWLGTASWIGHAIVVASAAAHLTKKAAQRLAPMSTLLNLTMVFPDHAPSRFGVTLRSGSLKKLTPEQLILSENTQEAAEQAMALVAELGRHEPRTRGHTERVRAYAELIGEEMGLSEDDLNHLRWGVLLHDVGKLTVPAHILNSTEKPTDEEWEILKKHPLEGQKILKPLHGWLGHWAFVSLHHHERWDGSGYPVGLKEEEICLGGRIAAVADAYDVITSKRTYKEAMSPAAAREELVRCAGGQFDPAVVRAFLRISLDDHGRSFGFLGWLFELPTVLRMTSSVASAAPATVSATATAAAALSVSVASVAGAPAEPPPAVAFADPTIDVVQLDEPIPTTSTMVIVIEDGAIAESTIVSAVPTTTTAAPTTTTTTTAAPTTTTTTTAAPTTTTTTTAAPTTTTTTSAPATGPKASPDSETVDFEGRDHIRILRNDVAGSNPVVSLEIVQMPMYADDLTTHGDHFDYWAGTSEVVDTFIYEICDSVGLCDQATVTITVIDD